MIGNAKSNAGFDSSGWYVGGALSDLGLDGDFEYSSIPVKIPVERSATGISVYGGYHFNRLLGLEATITISSNMADNISYLPGLAVFDYDAALSEIAIAPKLTIPIGERFSFFLKGGVAIATYSELYDNVPLAADDAFFWGGYGFIAGAGFQVAVMQHLFLRLNYDYSDLEFEPTDDTFFNGVTINELPDINTTLEKVSVGLHYQF